MASIVTLGAIYFLLRTQHASATTQTSVLGVSAAILGLLATYFTAILDEPDKASKSAPAGGPTSPSESSTINPSPGESDAAKDSPSPKVAPPTSPTVDGSASINSAKPPKKSTTWGHIRATKSPFKGLCLEAEGDTVVTANCRDSKEQLWKKRLTAARSSAATRAAFHRKESVADRPCSRKHATEAIFRNGNSATAAFGPIPYA
ncbi:hypothetical protein [Streptomyces collinus]|uniref:Uncharacterized protein n=1 Tax=Streptomyces collinus TaxID=42684 RepID=A0AA89Q0M7_STRCU|nr:hypothetical protein [Streptomyces collinus]MBB5812267.1 hypothetical protein [Streptomyces collinus]WMX65432.1 hypothetical protein RFN52_19585 [Streptomyces collinus]